jgi:uncharacterized protein (DUF488 family)
LKTVFTIGHTKKTLKQFVDLLSAEEIDALIDVRRHNTSQLAGYSKSDILQYVLEECHGIRYRHELALAPPPDLLARYRKENDWAAYAQEFTRLMEADGMVAHARAILGEHERPCLLCSEHAPDCCHRRLLVERLQAEWPELEIVHLPRGEQR